MNADLKKKNICDLNYNTVISYFNAFIVILGSGLITFWITFNPPLRFWLLLYIKFLVSMGIVLVGLIGWGLFHGKLESIKNEIKNIGNQEFNTTTPNNLLTPNLPFNSGRADL